VLAGLVLRLFVRGQTTAFAEQHTSLASLRHVQAMAHGAVKDVLAEAVVVFRTHYSVTLFQA
jgi:hypothetical protein